MFKLMKTVLEIIRTLNDKGYRVNFEIKDGKIKSGETQKEYTPEELIIEKSYRYEGDSNPDDNAVVYVLTAKSGERGILVDSYGAYGDVKLAKIIRSIPVREEHDLQDIESDK